MKVAKNLKLRLLLVSTIALAISSGCVSQQPEVLRVNPVIDYYSLDNFTGKSEGMFTIINGSIPEVKENLKDIVINKVAQQYTFFANDNLNFVVFRGVFNSGGYGINIDRVEKQGNVFTVYATYIDPGEGVGVTWTFTQPAAIIPIGKLATGDYKATLKVTKVLTTIKGRKVIETEKELSVLNFKVKTPEEGVSQQPEVLKINPVIDDLSSLGGFYAKSEGIFTVSKGSISEVKENLRDIINKNASQQYTFSVNDNLNFVVFRGVFNSGGYGINIDKVERQGNTFTVYATYIDPGEGILVTAAFTQPVAIIPIGRLTAGDYKATLKVTKVLTTIEGKKVIETEKELGVFNFKVITT